MVERLDKAINGAEQHLDVVQSEQQNFTVKPIENAVIKRAMQGEEKAFEQVFMGTYRYVFATVRKYLKNEQDAYDAIQDTYIRVYKGISRLQSADSFYPWLHRIAENCAKDILKFSENALSVSPDDVAEKATAEDQSVNADVVADVSEVLKLLPKEQVDLLIRVYYDKMRVSEIARMQNLPVTTVHNRLKAAKKKLKELLKIRGIDKPIYSGELVTMISTALRDAIGTELLSMAVAEEILHTVTGSKNKKGAFVVSVFARKMRNTAAKNIAALLLLACCLTVAFVALIARIMTKGPHSDENGFSTNISTTASASLISSHTLASTTTTATSTKTSTHSSKSVTTSASLTAKTSSATTAKTTAQPLILHEADENFGTFTEDGYLDIATSGDRIYAAVNDIYLITAKKDAGQLDRILITNFYELYGDSGCFLNVFNDKVYWINQNAESRFVLNRCNIDGSGHYTKVFDEFDCTFLTDMLVASDGIYFLAGIHGDREYTNSATLYRTDHDFNIKDTLENVADYTLIKDKIYYLYGHGNGGVLYSANRVAFDNQTNISPDRLTYGSVCSVGELLVLGQYNQYAHSNSVPCSNLTIIDSVTGKIVRSLKGEAGELVKVKDVSPLDGGTVIYEHNGVLKTLNIATGGIQNLNSPFGTVYGKYKYLKFGKNLIMGDLYADSAFYSFH